MSTALLQRKAGATMGLLLPDLRSEFWLPVRPDQTGSFFLIGTDRQARIRLVLDPSRPKFKVEIFFVIVLKKIGLKVP